MRRGRAPKPRTRIFGDGAPKPEAPKAMQRVRAAPGRERKPCSSARLVEGRDEAVLDSRPGTGRELASERPGAGCDLLCQELP